MQIWTFSVVVIFFFTGGILWPVEGMPTIVQRVFHVNPIMVPTSSLRCIMLRGWSVMDNFQVQLAYITSVANSMWMFALGAVFFNYSVK